MQSLIKKSTYERYDEGHRDDHVFVSGLLCHTQAGLQTCDQYLHTYIYIYV
jgi:hypothetical protein